MKTSFYLYQTQEEIFDSLSDSMAGKLIKTIFDHERGEEINLPINLKRVFIPIRQILDVNRENYEKICKINKDNIAKRWKLAQNNTTVYDRIPTNTENTNGNDIDIDKKDSNTENNFSSYKKNVLKPKSGLTPAELEGKLWYWAEKISEKGAKKHV